MTNTIHDDFEDLPADEREHMRRFCKPDGICLHCGQPADLAEMSGTAGGTAMSLVCIIAHDDTAGSVLAYQLVSSGGDDADSCARLGWGGRSKPAV